jgi:hypothetical protein
MTIEFWIKTASLGDGFGRFLVSDRNEGRGDGFYIIANGAGGLVASDNWGSGSGCNCNIADDTWHHVVYTQSGVQQHAQWWIDGQKTSDIGGWAMTNPNGYGPSGNAWLSWDMYDYRGTYGTGLATRMDEFAFYKHPLSPARIQAHYAAR